MDINEAIDNEIPDANKMKDLIEERNKFNHYKKDLESRRKVIDHEIKEFLTRNNINSLEHSLLKVESITSKSAGRWNKDKLYQILSPLEMEKVFSEGKQYEYIKLSEIQKKNENNYRSRECFIRPKEICRNKKRLFITRCRKT